MDTSIVETQMQSESGRAYGWVIAVASVVSVAAMARHPTPQGPDLQHVVREILSEGATTAAVHAVLMVTTGSLLFGFFGFSQRLRNRPLAQAGFVAYAIGSFALFGAMVVSGFLTQGMVSAYSSPTPDENQTIAGLLRMSYAFTQAWAHVATTALSLAIFSWSVALIGQRGVQQWIGWFGVAAAAIPGVAVGTGVLQLDVHGMLLVILAQALWNLAIAVQLIGQKL